MVMSLLFVGVAALAVGVTGDLVLLALSVAGTVLSVFRLHTLVACRRKGVAKQIVDRTSASTHERRFGLFYISFAAILGLFGARAMMLRTKVCARSSPRCLSDMPQASQRR
ncbi:MAG: hypothetical protein WKG07_20890 [Hymenobacter sp.]